MTAATLFKTIKKTGERRYQIEYKRKNYEVVCPEYVNSEGNNVIVIPDFILLRRKYPAEVYIFAINLYSSNPDISQRAVAKATQEKYGLSKFSHSTVCRSLKALESSIMAAAGAVSDSGGEESLSERDGCRCDNTATDKQTNRKRAFPSTADTAARRSSIAAFIRSITGSNESAVISEITRKIIKYWYDKYKLLLI